MKVTARSGSFLFYFLGLLIIYFNPILVTNFLYLSYFPFQMKLTTIIVLTACFAAAIADVKDLKNNAGRFLSLPNIDKCANRKCPFAFLSPQALRYSRTRGQPIRPNWQ